MRLSCVDRGRHVALLLRCRNKGLRLHSPGQLPQHVPVARGERFKIPADDPRRDLAADSSECWAGVVLCRVALCCVVQEWGGGAAERGRHSLISTQRSLRLNAQPSWWLWFYCRFAGLKMSSGHATKPWRAQRYCAGCLPMHSGCCLWLLCCGASKLSYCLFFLAACAGSLSLYLLSASRAKPHPPPHPLPLQLLQPHYQRLLEDDKLAVQMGLDPDQVHTMPRNSWLCGCAVQCI